MKSIVLLFILLFNYFATLLLCQSGNSLHFVKTQKSWGPCEDERSLELTVGNQQYNLQTKLSGREGTSLGRIQTNTNAALPSSYNFKEYVFAEPSDQGNCTGKSNSTTIINEVFLAQTHRNAIGHPFFFTIGHRPVLLQLAITGTGSAPDVQVEGKLKGNSLGKLCLKGPATLSATIDLKVPDFKNYFSVTLPKSWIQNGLELMITAGNQSRLLTSAELKIGPYTEMNLVMVNMDIMDYNSAPPLSPIFDNFLQEMASAIPASVIRFGVFPEKLPYQELIANNNTEQLVRLKSKSEMSAKGIMSEGNFNSVATLALRNLHRSTGDYLSTVYFGNTLNLRPGGWGGGKSFVGFDYKDIFIHELGHALSLPHWGEGSFNNPNSSEYDFLYPYGGATNNGGGRGQSWNFIQDIYEFVNPICQYDDRGKKGLERSDCMQRTHACLEQRTNSQAGPWDGFGDFSALAMHRYLVGASVTKGQVSDNNILRNYQFTRQDGFPIMTLNGDKRVYTRDVLQPQAKTFEERFDLPGDEKLEQEVYLIYGSAHQTQSQANIVFKPVKFKGTLSPIIDPTNATTFAQLKGNTYIPLLSDTRDILLKMTYADGSILHAINPYHSYSRAPYTWTYNIWRHDICHFSLVVPGNKELTKVELYQRPFCVRSSSDPIAGNINYSAHTISASNFMDNAIFQAKYEFGQALVKGGGTLGNRVWHDLNQNGKEDNNESGIANISLVLWGDSDGDGIPDFKKFMGVAKTDKNGYYSFSGIAPGKYLVFVWSVDNWKAGEPLNGMVPTRIFVNDPNTDINNDNNGRPGNAFAGLGERDIVSGIITLTADGEPLNDGDRKDDWFDYDSPGNMTIDFAFHIKDAIVSVSNKTEQVIKLYPNPFEDYIIIESEIFKGQSLRMINTDGKILSQTALTSNRHKIDITNWPAGVYTAVIMSKDGYISGSKHMVKVDY